MLKIAVRYYTKTGNTKKLAEAIAKAIGSKAFDISIPLDENVDILFLGSSVYAAGVDEAVKTFISELSSNIGVVINFSTAALLPSTYKQVKKLMEERNIKVSNEEFHCRGSFSFMHKGKPDVSDCNKAAEFAKRCTRAIEKQGKL